MRASLAKKLANTKRYSSVIYLGVIISCI